MNIERKEVKLNDVGLLAGIELTFPKVFSEFSEVATHINETYFEESGNKGFFKLMPQERKELATMDFMDKPNKDRNIFVDSIIVEEEVTKVSMLFFLDDFSEPEDNMDIVDYELECFSKELNEYLLNKYITGWKQFSIKQ